jgi:hypothetical protein
MGKIRFKRQNEDIRSFFQKQFVEMEGEGKKKKIKSD